jgi:hypothetical protein
MWHIDLTTATTSIPTPPQINLLTATANMASIPTPSMRPNIIPYDDNEDIIDWPQPPQIIQKSLIGSAQLDYISNVLLGAGLAANNQTIVSGKKYTQLEQNWDEAYGFLTLNPVFLLNSTDATKGTSESFLGSYIWEFNKAAYAKIYPAFLKGRAAIANNDIPEMKSQALFIRTEMEKAIALSAIGYLNKWKSGTTDAARIHAIAEGLGFIYSLRYCNINDVDDQFSDVILLDLVGSTDGYWDLTNTKINTAIDAITLKFKL